MRCPAILTYSSPHRWVSCQSIAAGLRTCYRNAYRDNCQFFTLDRSHEPSEVARVAREIFQARPDRLVFSESLNPIPAPVIWALKELFGDAMPPVYIHVYGDFTRACVRWLQLEQALTGSEVYFVCASSRQRELISSLIHGGREQTTLCPFPVNEQSFYFDPRLRLEERKKLGLGDEDRLIVYTGRMTLQKNVLRLVSEFCALLSDDQRNFLFLAGGLDNFSGPFDHRTPVPGLFYSRYQSLITNLPEKYRERIRHLGVLSPDRLQALYNAADGFASLSTYHDEDFGMAPVEALMTGAQACLTDWGGYADFTLDGRSVFSVPVQIDEAGLHLESAHIQLALRRLVDLRAGDQERMQRAERCRERFSLAAVTQKIQALHTYKTAKFTGFSSAMHSLARRLSDVQAGRPAFPEGMGRSSPYYELYKPYLCAPPSLPI